MHRSPRCHTHPCGSGAALGLITLLVNLPRALRWQCFAIIILTLTVLLQIPAATTTGQRAPLIDSLFTATSAVCVTGLATVDTAVFSSARTVFHRDWHDGGRLGRHDARLDPRHGRISTYWADPAVPHQRNTHGAW